MKTILILFLALSTWTLQAQSLQSQVLADGGMHGETPGGTSLCWTLGGQIETNIISNGTTTMTQGFMQPEYCATYCLSTIILNSNNGNENVIAATLIQSNATISPNANVIYDANIVELTQGFQSPSSSNLEIQTDGCNSPQ